MVLDKRYCVDYDDGSRACYREDGFWYSDVSRASRFSDLLTRTCSLTTQQKGTIVKWVILISFFSFFFLWFVGGYIHAKRRLKKGQQLLGYHRVRPPLLLKPNLAILTDSHSSLYPTQHAAATVKLAHPKTTSLSTNRKTPTNKIPTLHTSNGRMAHGRNPRPCIKTTMPRHNTLRHRVQPRRTPTKVSLHHMLEA